jgi:DNA-binding response OmpR family regulator
MSKLRANAAAIETIKVLSISPLEEDHLSLQRIFSSPGCPVPGRQNWVIRRELSFQAALPVLRQTPITIVVAERDLSPVTWREVLEEIRTLPDPPLLIVTSRLADERLWAEALNLGAYDVLAKPFRDDEVVRALGSAWLRRHREANVEQYGSLTRRAGANC